MEWLRFILAASFLVSGLTTAAISVFGVYKFKFVLNRMHAAALCDTLALMLVLLSMVILCGFQFATLKLLLIIVFLWFASPVSSHLLALLEVTINEHLKDDCDVSEVDELDE